MPKTWEAKPMLLQCANDDPGTDSVAGWLRAGTLTCLSELNEECLELCLAQARAGAAPPLCAAIAHEWSALDAAGGRHASGGLSLLLDAGFAQLTAWRAGGARQVGDEGAPGYAPWFTVPAAVPLAQAVFTFAWHLARCQGSAACRLRACRSCAATRSDRCARWRCGTCTACDHAGWRSRACGGNSSPRRPAVTRRAWSVPGCVVRPCSRPRRACARRSLLRGCAARRARHGLSHVAPNPTSVFERWGSL